MYLCMKTISYGLVSYIEQYVCANVCSDLVVDWVYIFHHGKHGFWYAIWESQDHAFHTRWAMKAIGHLHHCFFKHRRCVNVKNARHIPLVVTQILLHLVQSNIICRANFSGNIWPKCKCACASTTHLPDASTRCWGQRGWPDSPSWRYCSSWHKVWRRPCRDSGDSKSSSL